MSSIVPIADVLIDVSPYYWMVVVGGISCFTMGFGIGANDVANNMGSAIGSGALSFRWAVVLAAVFELVGAVGFGASVTDSIKAGVIDPEAASTRPDLVMWSNLAALLTGTVWLVVASAMGLPVSTTHTIIGALLGSGLAMPQGYQYIDWAYVGTVVASWFASPILCAIFTALVFGLYRHFILRQETELAVKRAKNSLWGTMFITFTVFGIFFVVKTPATKHWAQDNVGASIGVGCGIGLVATLIVTPIFHWYSKRKMTPEDFNENDKIESATKKSLTTSSSSLAKQERISSDADLFDQNDEDIDCNEKMKKKWYSLPWFMDIKAEALNEDVKTAQQQERAERFHPKTEQYFAYLQVITASLACVVHGANDVANATAPFSGIHGIYIANGFEEKVSTPYWILALGGAAIGIGVFFLGHKVIMSMGFKLAAITPGRGFCMELGSTFVMVIGSFAGIPLSTTHCKVGGTLAIALMERSDAPSRRNFNGRMNPGAVNCKFVIKIIFSWIATLVVAGAMSALVFALGIYSPGIDVPSTA